MNESIRNFFTRIISFLTAAAVLAGNVMLFYYPKYQENKAEYEITVPVQGNTLRVMSCNVRCINPMDLGKKTWFYRADLVIKNIVNNAPGIIGFQEVTKWQYQYLCDSLPQYDSTITYRDTAFNSEGCPVFYNTELYALIDQGTFWLSETPDVMSKGWGAANYRVCGYSVLEIRETGTKFVIFNTHLDHISEAARINGIKLVLEKTKEFGSYPSVLMGDFNAHVGSTTYNAAVEIFDDAALMTDNSMPDSCTYHNYGLQLNDGRIDYFMISKDTFNVNEYKVITDTYDGVYPSDHFPIFTELEIK